MVRRHKLDIYADILKLAANGAKTTKLVYQANTNFTNIKNYLEMLSEKGLVEFYDGHVHTTEKGIEYLERYEELMLVFNSVGENEQGEEGDESESLVLTESKK